MRLRLRPEEVPAGDVQLLSFDPEMSQAMADGIATIWQIQNNVHQLKKVRDTLGDQAAGSSAELNDHAAKILTSKLFDAPSEGSSDPTLIEGFFENTAETFSAPDEITDEALSKLGHLAVLIGAKDKVIEKLDQQWQESFAPRILGHEVLIWRPKVWDNSGRSGGFRYKAPYSSAGHGFTNMSLSRGSVVTGTVTEISLQENGTVTLADGVHSHNSYAAYATAPDQVAEEDVKPWGHFRRFKASELFQTVRESQVPHPKIKIEEI